MENYITTKELFIFSPHPLDFIPVLDTKHYNEDNKYFSHRTWVNYIGAELEAQSPLSCLHSVKCVQTGI